YWGVWLLMQIALEQGRTPSASDAVWGILIGEVGSACYCITALSLSSFRTKTKEYAASGHSSDIFIEKNKPSSATHQRKPKLPIRKCLYKKEYSYKKRKDSIFLRKTHCLYGKSTKIYVPCPYR
ncbi:MAG: hypothetical protein LIO96_06945, partial [Lachnospiraceae bacterium]|nr:hypothetical protein [Lachnospiraceae bacterium]